MIQIDDRQADLISQRINKNKQVNSMINKNLEDVNVSDSQTEEKDSRNDDLVEILKQQIEDLKKDKNEYINQVNNLNGLLKQQQTLLSQQQSLQLQSNKKIKALEIELNEIKEDVIEAQTVNINDKVYNELKNSDDRNKKGFLSKWFKK